MDRRGHGDALFACPGELPELCRSFDWATTSLGPVAAWSPSLRTAVGTLLRSGFPMCLSWGPELVLLYNDAFVPTLGAKHPAALGARISDVFAEVWDEVGHRQWDVLAGGESIYEEALPLVLEMGDGPEETFYTFCYSQVPEDAADRGPGGVLSTVSSTTAAVVSARRMTLLNELAVTTRATADRPAAARAALAAIAGAEHDVHHVACYLPRPDGALELVGSGGDGPAWPAEVPLDTPASYAVRPRPAPPSPSRSTRPRAPGTGSRSPSRWATGTPAPWSSRRRRCARWTPSTRASSSCWPATSARRCRWPPPGPRSTGAWPRSPRPTGPRRRSSRR